MKTVTLIGDCIRRDYQPTVSEELADIADVWGPKETIKTTRDVLAQLDEWVIGPKPDVFHFNCGLHEIRRFRAGDPQTVPLPEFRRNLEEIFRRIRESTETAITWAHTMLIACAAELAGRYGVAVVDLHRLTRESGMGRYMARNGLHYTPEGYALLGKAVAKVIRQELQVGEYSLGGAVKTA